MVPIPNDLPPWAVGLYPAGGDSWSATARRVVTGLVGAAADGLTPNLRTRAQSFNEWLARAQEWIEYLRTEQGAGIYGDGSDGAGAIAVNTTLTTPLYHTDLTVSAGAVVTTAGYPIFCTGTLTVTGAGSAISWDGNPGADGSAGGAGGAALATTILRGSSAGGAGGGDGLNGTAGTTTTNAFVTLSPAGGGGGAGDGTTGGAGGDLTMVAGPTRTLWAATSGHAISNGSARAIGAGAGGGGGGGGLLAAVGGGGGSGGGEIVIVARRIILASSGVIGSLGGDGGDGQAGAGTDGGGGGGGSGGLIYLVRRESDESGGSVLVTGGAAGAAGGGTAAAGAVGTDGYVVRLSG